MRIRTLKFGEVDVPEERLLQFPDGIPGFPQLGRCCLLPQEAAPGLRWLQSVDDPALVFLTLEPHLVFPNYHIELPEADAVALGLTDPGRAAVLAMVTISADGSAISANLAAPIVINTETLLARQVIMDGDSYPVRQPIGRGEGRAAAGRGGDDEGGRRCSS